MRQQDERDLRTALREEADRHRPDRDAMLDRIAQGRAAYAHRPITRAFALLRPAAAALAVAVVLVLAVAGVRLSNRGPAVDDRAVAVQPPVPATSVPAVPVVPATTPAPKPSAAGTRTPVSKPPRHSAGTPSPPVRTSPSGTAPPGDRDGYLSSTGLVDPNSNKSWTQDTVVVESTRKVTALDVSVEVALTPGVVETGRFSTVPANLLTVTSSRTAEKLMFRFTLQPGASLAPGDYKFAVQFNHDATNRTAGADTYVAQVSGDAKAVQVSGGFTPPQ